MSNRILACLSIWPDLLIPEEMRLPNLIAFHETHQTISSGEIEERMLMLDLHPLRSASTRSPATSGGYG